ncbi:ABC transporter substrate-binding protein [Amycolatopsis jiangsuensis]|uniref:Iron complex transport system substrate-binding protein n=1 Tax=Amycolatopsis jiangsuensis TaxID=1181879 RepID=A0A840IL98_9PSEU|nr:ABC transporter substrate-binding protein [Amycolatopsis jiangsuensis]MBB4683086.1 iron complex transport system substrate-binding protein [Amycolatopsis jiangsuensis]
MSLSRRGFLSGTAGASLLLAGCGSGGASPAKQTSTPGFPVTVPGQLGSTTVAAPPRRVVAAGYLRDTDLALALGAELVLSVRNQSFAKGLAPWAKLRSGTETAYVTDGGLPLEKIAAAKPDLILAADDYSLAGDWSNLSSIAPTLGYQAGPGKDGWPEMTRRTGAALGKPDQAAALVKQVRDKIDGVGKAHPEFAGKTFTFGPVSTNSVYTINSTADAAATFFSQLGLKLSPKAAVLPSSTTPGRAQISPERLDLLDADVLIISYDSPASRATFEANPLFESLPAVKRGAYVPLDQTIGIAMAFPSVLSIPYALDVVAPKLATALKKGA